MAAEVTCFAVFVFFVLALIWLLAPEPDVKALYAPSDKYCLTHPDDHTERCGNFISLWTLDEAKAYHKCYDKDE